MLRVSPCTTKGNPGIFTVMQIGDDEPKRLSKASQHDGSGDLLILIKRSLLSIPLSLKAGFYFYFYFYFCFCDGSSALRFFIKHRYLHKKKVFLPEIKCIYKAKNKTRNKSRKRGIPFYFLKLYRTANFVSIFLVTSFFKFDFDLSSDLPPGCRCVFLEESLPSPPLFPRYGISVYRGH